jgi:hypothetical protein
MAGRVAVVLKATKGRLTALFLLGTDAEQGGFLVREGCDAGLIESGRS